MMAMVRFVYDFLRKEELMAFDYIRKHPRAKWLIFLDAIVTLSLVFGGFAYASQSSRSDTSAALMRVGAVAMTSSQFIDHVRTGGGKVYWLGDISGSGISSNESQRNIVSVTYAKTGSNSGNLGRHEITIVTHRNSNEIKGEVQSGTSLQPDSSVTASGLVVAYNKNSMMDEVVSMNGTFNVVSIHYPAAQTFETLMGNAMALRLVF